jgi:hypothetical protein
MRLCSHESLLSHFELFADTLGFGITDDTDSLRHEKKPVEAILPATNDYQE